jgi:cytochrome c oxidase subunit 2
VGRFWSILFLLVPVLGVLAFVLPMADIWPFQGHWLPQDVSANGYVIDNLFYFILILTGVIFIATSLVLFWFLWKYDAEKNPEPVKYMHGSHSLEVIWSIIPSVALLFIAIYQMDAWADAKMKRPTINVGGAEVLKPPLAEVTGRQFEWRIRYAGEDGLIGTEDDVHTVNDLRIPLNEETVLLIKSQDVLHIRLLARSQGHRHSVPVFDAALVVVGGLLALACAGSWPGRGRRCRSSAGCCSRAKGDRFRPSSTRCSSRCTRR